MDSKETMAQLVAAHAGTGRELTFAALAQRSVDPRTGYQPSPNLLWRIASGEMVKVNPALVRAVTAGLGLPPERIARAAAVQFIGWVPGDA